MKSVYVCSECGKEYPVEPDRYLCSECSAAQKEDEPLRGILEVRLEGKLPDDWEAVRQGQARRLLDGSLEADVRSVLPVDKKFFPPIPVGGTPLWQPEPRPNNAQGPRLFLKDDTANPTSSLKDRASYLVAAFARQYGLKDIVVASTGNAGSSMAGVAAAAGLNVRLYLPVAAPPAKIVQAMQYGAHVIKVDGTYDDAFDASLAYVTEHGGLSRNTAHNPLTVEGKKTAALEIFLQLGGCLPDSVFVPTGDGVILAGIYKGFEDLISWGLAKTMPKVFCVQSEGSCSLTRALESGAFGARVPSTTLADSISVDVPRGGYIALQRMKRHGGESILVSDNEILKGQLYASRLGLFCEPAAAAAVAGFLKVKDTLPAGSKAVVMATGNGLKDIASAMKGVEA
ncbi:MAG: pyridoxal-5'-phosphate-dependent protein subunit beta [Spirochaetales bacterium]|nr:MAG: pyridoxal-5'-phosphate-dependent protein subunit beta [Spirochaetales bacterium]